MGVAGGEQSKITLRGGADRRIALALQPLPPGPDHCLVIPKGVGAARRGPKSGVHRGPDASTSTGGVALRADESRGRAEGCHISCCPPQLSLPLRPLLGALRGGVARMLKSGDLFLAGGTYDVDAIANKLKIDVHGRKS